MLTVGYRCCTIEKFRVYLIDKPFIIKTNCNSLKLLQNKQNIIPRISRCFLRISEFKFEIQYVQGKSNEVADALSRYPVEHAPTETFDPTPVCLNLSVTTDWVAFMQRADAPIKS